MTAVSLVALVVLASLLFGAVEAWSLALVGLLAALSSAAGVFLRSDLSTEPFVTVRGDTVEYLTGGAYRFNGLAIAAEGVGWDAVTLFLVVPALLLSAPALWRGSLRAQLLVLGLLAYFLYQYPQYAMDIETPYIPAFHVLKPYLEDLRNRSTDEAGVWKIDEGEAYYAYMLHKETSTSLSADEIHSLGLREVERLQPEIWSVLEELGQSPDDDFAAAMQAAIEACGYIDATSPAGKQQVLGTYEAIIEEVEPLMDEMFDLRPRRDVIVVGDEGVGAGGFYVNGPADSDRRVSFIPAWQTPGYRASTWTQSPTTKLSPGTITR